MCRVSPDTKPNLTPATIVSSASALTDVESTKPPYNGPDECSGSQLVIDVSSEVDESPGDSASEKETGELGASLSAGPRDSLGVSRSGQSGGVAVVVSPIESVSSAAKTSSKGSAPSLGTEPSCALSMSFEEVYS